MRIRDLILVLCAVAVVIAFRPTLMSAPGPSPSHSPTANQEPKLTLEVVRRGPYLDDLVVTAKLESPVPVGLYLREDTPVAYLGIRHERWSWDLALEVFAQNGYPNHLSPIELHDEIRTVQEFEWEFRGSELVVPDRDQVDSWLAGRVGFYVHLPYQNLQVKPDHLKDRHRSVTAELPEVH